MRPLPKVAFWRLAVALVTLIGTPSFADVQLLSASNPETSSTVSAAGDSYLPIVSADGRYVLFASTANNLTPNSSTEFAATSRALKLNLYRRDRFDNSTMLVSVNLSGGRANDDCYPVALSTNGQLALFESSASDLVAFDTNGGSDVFVRDLESGVTTLVSVSTNGTSGNNESGDASMTPDGRWVAFTSLADNLVTGDTNEIRDVFRRDLSLATTTLVSVGAQPRTFGSFRCDAPEISADGRHVAFLSNATNLVPGIAAGLEVYVRDLLEEHTYIPSTNARPYFTNTFPTSLRSFNHALSADGRFVAFETRPSSPPGFDSVFLVDLQTDQAIQVATNAYAGSGSILEIQNLDLSANGRYLAFIGSPSTTFFGGASTRCVYLWDAESATTRIISTNLDGTVQSNSICGFPILDPTGAYICFQSTATNLTTNLVKGDFHLYLHELASGLTKLVDIATNGAGARGTLWSGPSVGPTAQFVAFDCDGADVVADDLNESADVFVRDLWAETTELISIHDGAFPSRNRNPGDISYKIALSADGRFATFTSSATNWVGGSGPRRQGIVLRDLLNGVTRLVSADTNGVANGNGNSFDPVISGNGRYVAFTSVANNLAPLDANNTSDVFVHDSFAGTTMMISTNRINNGSGSGASRLVAMSQDARFVLFFSRSTDLTLVPISLGTDNLFLRDRNLRTNYVLTRTGCSSAAMTPDGRIIAFVGSTNTSLNSQLHVWDSQTGTYVGYTLPPWGQLAVSPTGRFVAGLTPGGVTLWDRIANTNLVVAAEGSFHAGLRFSADEHFLVYSTPTPFDESDTNGVDDVVLYDLLAATNCLISHAANLQSTPNGPSFAPDISADGRLVVYTSYASDLVAADGNRAKDVFLYHRLGGSTTLLSRSVFGDRSGNQASTGATFGGDGQTVLFHSIASDLAGQDFNLAADAFFIRLPSANPIFVGQVLYFPGSNQPVTIHWIAPPGHTYAVEYKDELSDSNWQPLDATVSIVNDIGSATDPQPNPNHRFYRIVAD